MSSLRVKIYQLATGEHVVCYRDPATQKRKRKKFGSRTEAKKHRSDLELRYQSRGPQSLNETPLEHYMKLHLEQYPNSRVRDRKNHFDSFCKEFGKRPISQIGKTELAGWFQKIKEENDLSDRTLNIVKSDINTFFHYLEDNGIITSSPLQKIRFDRKPPLRRPRVVLSPDEIHKILEGANTFSPKLLYPVLFIAAYTGARRDEVLKLKRKDVDFETGLIHYRQTKNRIRFYKP